MQNIADKISKIGIIPVVKIDNAKDALKLGKALCDGGIPCAEITFRTDAAKEAIEIMSKEFPDMLIGAGTVLTAEKADEAMQAGAKFIVSPGLNPDVVKHCQAKGYPIFPGVCTPSDVEKALSLGLNVLKFFPAEASGGVGMIKAMSAPYTAVRFLPTGGINAENINNYLDNPKVIACGGSFMVSDKLINAGEFDKIRELSEEAMQKMLGFALDHIGYNLNTSDDAKAIADKFNDLFGFKTSETGKSFFAGSFVEAMKNGGYGEKGHIAIRTRDCERAVYFLQGKGVEFIEESKSYDANGRLKVVYLKGDIGGFAIHLVEKK